jgi:opacity protein-like surface antigen
MKRFVFLAVLLVAQVTSAQPAPAIANSNKPVNQVTVELRTDGRSYLAQAKEPFTGMAVKAHEGSPTRVAEIVPYKQGLKHGTEQGLSKGGTVKQEIDWVEGKATNFRIYYSDGKLKADMQTDAKGMPNGSHKRYHPNGRLMLENTMANAIPTGEEKQYDANGKLIAHYRLEMGAIKEIISETPEAKAAREKSKPAKP